MLPLSLTVSYYKICRLIEYTILFFSIPLLVYNKYDLENPTGQFILNFVTQIITCIDQCSNLQLDLIKLKIKSLAYFPTCNLPVTSFSYEIRF